MYSIVHLEGAEIDINVANLRGHRFVTFGMVEFEHDHIYIYIYAKELFFS